MIYNIQTLKLASHVCNFSLFIYYYSKSIRTLRAGLHCSWLIYYHSRSEVRPEVRPYFGDGHPAYFVYKCIENMYVYNLVCMYMNVRVCAL